MTSTAAPLPPEDPTLAVAERQLAMLSRLASIGMAVCEAQGLAAVAASNAAVAAVSDTAWQCERDRALALAGSKDAAEAFRKGSRTLRLTLMMEKTTAEWLRDLRLGNVRAAKTARVSGDHALADRQTFSYLDIAETERPDTEQRETECLVEFERPEDMSSFRGAPKLGRRRAAFGSPASATCGEAASREVGTAKNTKEHQEIAPTYDRSEADEDCLDGEAIRRGFSSSREGTLFAAPA